MLEQYINTIILL